MFLARIRFLLVLIFLGLGIWLHVVKGIGAAWYLYVAAMILLLVHFLFSNVSAAFVLLRRGKLDQAEQLIDRIKKPEWLLTRHKAYYHFTKGMIAAQRNVPEEAKTDLSRALDIGLRTATDNALAALNIANIAFKGDDRTTARTFVDRAKSFNSSDLVIKEHLERLDALLTNGQPRTSSL